MRILACLALLATVAAPLSHGTAHYRAMPFVGCASDGQQGPQPAPDHPTRLLPIWTPARAGLAYYVGSYTGGVLAPAGWQCFETEGSNGSTLLVTPDTTRRNIAGPAVQLSSSNGGTSGRFTVGEIAARIFPVARDYVRDLEREGLFDKPLVHHPFASDRILSRDDTHVRFVTPAGQQGLGTQSFLSPSDRPIDGLAVLHPRDDMALVMLFVRLPAAQGGLADTIIAQAQS